MSERNERKWKRGKRKKLWRRENDHWTCFEVKTEEWMVIFFFRFSLFLLSLSLLSFFSLLRKWLLSSFFFANKWISYSGVKLKNEARKETRHQLHNITWERVRETERERERNWGREGKQVDITYPFVSPHVQQSQNGCELFSGFPLFFLSPFLPSFLSASSLLELGEWRERERGNKNSLTLTTRYLIILKMVGRKQKKKRREEEM